MLDRCDCRRHVRLLEDSLTTTYVYSYLEMFQGSVEKKMLGYKRHLMALRTLSSHLKTTTTRTQPPKQQHQHELQRLPSPPGPGRRFRRPRPEHKLLPVRLRHRRLRNQAA